MKTQLLFLLGGALLTFFSGCQHSEGSLPAQTPQTYGSFAIVAAAADPAAPMSMVRPIEETIVSSLTSKGYTQAPPADADLLVNLSASFYHDALINSTQRSLMIDAVDRRTGKRFWMDKIERSASAGLPPELLQKEIAKRLTVFPEASRQNNP